MALRGVGSAGHCRIGIGRDEDAGYDGLRRYAICAYVCESDIPLFLERNPKRPDISHVHLAAVVANIFNTPLPSLRLSISENRVLE